MNNADHHIPALKRAAALLSALGDESVNPTSTGLAQAAGISQSSCYRTLRTLESMGWIRPDRRGRFELGDALLQIVRPLMKPDRLAEIAAPHLLKLVRQTELTAKLSLRRGESQQTLARVESPRPTSVSVRVDAYDHVVTGASGGALLSSLEDQEIDQQIIRAPAEAWENNTPDLVRQRVADCRKLGFCKNIGMHPQGIDAVSAPVHTRIGEASVTLVGLRGDFDGAQLSRRTKAVKQAASDIEETFRKIADEGPS